MVVISAGVVMNLILAAALFVGVFMHGLSTEPAKIGAVRPGSAASRAVSLGGEAEPGLKPGDVILSVNGRTPNSFNDLILATAMTSKGGSLRVAVRRPGVPDIIDFDVRPEIGEVSGLQEIGVEPPRTNRILPAKNAAGMEEGKRILARGGLEGLEPGMRLISVAGQPVSVARDAFRAVAAADGKTVEAVFARDDGSKTTLQIELKALLQTGLVAYGKKSMAPVDHLLGLTPVMKVAPAADETEAAARQGLQDDDIFARVGSIEFPSIAEGRAEIRANTGKRIEVSVLRLQADGSRKLARIDPPPTVKSKGIIGFAATDSQDTDTLVSVPPARIMDARHPGDGAPPAASRLITLPGTRIVSVAGTPVANFTQLRAALRTATRSAFESGASSATVKIGLDLPSLQAGSPTSEVKDWTLTRDDLHTLFSLGWRSRLDASIFEPEEFLLQAKGPADALRMGLSETHRVMMSTYITFARLFEGTVKVEHLKGPVGIAHMGTRIAERGLIWLLFFMALISVNLAVINFLPLPIVDGGQFLFLVFEQIRGKPVPIAVQNIATIAGLILIGTMFIIVTFHDIANLFTG
jgi:regulator of sigma E protease